MLCCREWMSLREKGKLVVDRIDGQEEAASSGLLNLIFITEHVMCQKISSLEL